jgi:hypothetical protein
MGQLVPGGRPVLCLFVGASLLSGCGGISGMSCDAIAEHAKEISATQGLQVRTVSNLQETSRSDTEARCTGQAELSDGRSTTLYLRAYEENGNTMVAYQETPDF